MKRIVMFSALVGLTAAPLLLSAAPVKADGLFGLFNRGSSSSYGRTYRGPRQRAPQVRGYRFGGDVPPMTLADTYTFDPEPTPPTDFNALNDYSPNPGGIIPNSLY